MNQKHQEDFVKLCSFLKDPNLAILESKLQEFNIFSILNLNRQEIRHSAMLAWLFNPQANHNLGTAPLKTLLLQLPEEHHPNTLMHISNLNPTEIEVSTESDTETGRIDILIKGKDFIIGIENKIDTTDTPGQLAKYVQYIRQQFADIPHRYLLYLTPEGSPPQNLVNDVIQLSYTDIDELIKHLLISIPQMSSPVHALLLQYQQLIQREITMEDNEIKKLCSQLYATHKDAIETILEYKIDIQAKMSNILSECIKATKKDIHVYRDSKCFFNFSPSSWDSYAFAKVPQGIWLKDCKDLILFEFFNNKKNIQIKLVVGPTGTNHQSEKIKQELLKRLSGDLKKRQSGTKWTTIYSEPLLKYTEAVTQEELENQLKNNLDQWLNNKYPELVAQIDEIMKQLQQDYERENAQ